jgi:hypothetical protein
MTTQLESARKGILTREMTPSEHSSDICDLEKSLLFPDIAKTTRQKRMPLKK